MNLAAQLNSSTILTPRERERAKTAQQRAEDVIYTLNHTFTCIGLTDFLIMPLLRGVFGLNIGHSHDEGGHGHHDHGHGHKHDHHGHHDHGHKSEKLPFWKQVRNWGVGEAIGDVGAAVVTIPIQRFFPGLMDGMRRVMEPVVGGFFKRGSQRAAHTWADRHGLAYDRQEVVDRAEKLYEYEMRHLPQMAMWTLSSIGLHYGVMKKLEPAITVGEFARMKAAGAGITALMVFGARAAAPDKAHAWDETAGKHVVVPLTKSVGKLFGLNEREVDDYHARRSDDSAPKNWAEKVSAEPAASAEAARGA